MIATRHSLVVPIADWTTEIGPPYRRHQQTASSQFSGHVDWLLVTVPAHGR
jgi:hypothetical protein